MYRRVVRVPSSTDVADLVAAELLQRLERLLDAQGRADVCLTGGNTANMVYERLAEHAIESEIDFRRIHFWWGDERFLPSTDPDRNSLQAVERLARTIPMHSMHVHMMASLDGRKDAHESAEEYEAELGDTHFDIVLLGIGEDGHCGSMFPGHASFEPTSRLVIGVEDAPKPPSERITLTRVALNRSSTVWFIATGSAKATAVAGALAGDESLPAATIHGEQSTIWFLDEAAAAQLPPPEECAF